MAGLMDLFTPGLTDEQKRRALMAAQLTAQSAQRTPQALMDMFSEQMPTGFDLTAKHDLSQADMDRAMGMAYDAMFAAPAGITAWHGSPYKFGAFDPTKIGSGEGAQAYGYGHYFAESPNVARRYQMGLAQANGEEVLYKNKSLNDLYNQIENRSMKLSGKNADIENQKLQLVEHMMLDKSPQELIPYAKETGFDPSVVDWLQNDVAKNVTIPGALYKIDLPDDQIAKMLDWDKPMSEAEMIRIYDAMQQSPLAGFAKPFQDNYYSRVERGVQATDGQDLLIELTKELGGPKYAAEALRSIDIPGVRYLDEASRGAGAGTSNFVVFPGNEGLIKMLEMNDKPMSLWGF